MTDVSTSVSLAQILRIETLKMTPRTDEFKADISLIGHNQHCGIELLDHNDRHCLQRVYFGKFWPSTCTKQFCAIENEIS